jgi:hypothetical protein
MVNGKEIANTIIQQLGFSASRMEAMIGAKNFMYAGSESWMSFRFKMNPKMNYCKITLNSMDTYDLEFGKIHGMKYKVVEEVKGIYNDGLKSVFEQTTQLYLSL